MGRGVCAKLSSPSAEVSLPIFADCGTGYIALTTFFQSTLNAVRITLSKTSTLVDVKDSSARLRLAKIKSFVVQWTCGTVYGCMVQAFIIHDYIYTYSNCNSKLLFISLRFGTFFPLNSGIPAIFLPVSPPSTDRLMVFFR